MTAWRLEFPKMWHFFGVANCRLTSSRKTYPCLKKKKIIKKGFTLSFLESSSRETYRKLQWLSSFRLSLRKRLLMTSILRIEDCQRSSRSSYFAIISKSNENFIRDKCSKCLMLLEIYLNDLKEEHHPFSLTWNSFDRLENRKMSCMPCDAPS